ncbi:MAG: hypothetical protein AB1696_28770 [Planctomycetota bacterium]
MDKLLQELCRGVAKASPDSKTYVSVNSIEGVQGFCLYSTDERFAMSILMRDIVGSLGEMCCIWKTEHYGAAGSILYRVDLSQVPETVTDDDEEDYMDFPYAEFERVFQVKLGWSEEDRLCFPELFLGRSPCYQLGPTGARLLNRREKSSVGNYESGAYSVLPLDELIEE